MLLTIIVFILILGLLILAHELGHFFSARLFHVKAEEFGFGYPPRAIGWVKDNNDKWRLVGRHEPAENFRRTVWSLNWWPIGGFVKIKGEDASNLKEPDSFGNRPLWQRFIMLVSGVVMNFLLCFVILSIAFMIGIPSMVDDEPAENLNYTSAKIQVMSLSPDSPAAAADLKVGDTILRINDEKITKIDQLQSLIAMSKNLPTEFIIERGQEQITKIITPQAKSETERAVIGVGLVKTAIVKYPWYEALYRGAETTVGLTITILKAFGQIIADLFSGGKVEAEVSGPVGIAVLTGQVVKLGWIYILQFAALLSLNLFIINLLPIPALDGGRILFLIIEKIKGRPVKQKIEATVHQIGFLLLISLIILVTFKDFHTYGGKIWQAIMSIF